MKKYLLVYLFAFFVTSCDMSTNTNSQAGEDSSLPRLKIDTLSIDFSSVIIPDLESFASELIQIEQQKRTNHEPGMAFMSVSEPDVDLVYQANPLTINPGQLKIISVPLADLDDGDSFSLSLKPESGNLSGYNDPYIYSAFKQANGTYRVVYQSRRPGNAYELAHFYPDWVDPGDLTAEFIIQKEDPSDLSESHARVFRRDPISYDAHRIYSEGQEPTVRDYQVSVQKDYYADGAYSGDYALEVDYNTNEYIYLYQNGGGGVPTSGGINALTFNTFLSNLNTLSVMLVDDNNQPLTSWQSVSQFLIGFPVSGWNKIEAPLSALNPSNDDIYGVAIRSNTSQTVKFDDIQFEEVDLIPDMKLPLPAGDDWYLTVEVGGDADCTNGSDDPFHFPSAAYYSLDFAPRNLATNNGSTVISNVKILAAAAGKVIEAPSTEHSFNGYYVRIDHDYPYDGTGLTSYYLHLQGSANGLLNQVIPQGKVLGLMGNTGESYGTHLHFQLKYDGDSSSSASELDDVFIEGDDMYDYTVGCRTDTPPTGFYGSTNAPIN